jgi:protein-S-isoprenylcysteine O-methyltransferase Ste14
MEMSMGKRPVIRYVVRESLGLAVMGATLFVSAGTAAWWQGWAALAVMLGWTAGMGAVILTSSPELLAERLGPRKGAKGWDILIMSAIGLLQLARYVAAGLDRRNAWTAGLPPFVQVEALVLCVLGQALMVWATASNRFFSQIVRVQTDRGHSVATGGPYRFLRHPGYAGSLVFELAVAVLLGSWPAMVMSVATSALLVVRTALEDGTLRRELPGYPDYARRVRFRLLPGIW